MTPQQIHEGNQLIAEFMGAEQSQFGDYMVFKVGNPAFIGKIDHADIMYHIRWDWLMPVVEKIEDLRVDFGGTKVFIPINIAAHKIEVGHSYYYDFVEVEGRTKLQATWTAVVQFLQWYNSHAQPQ